MVLIAGLAIITLGACAGPKFAETGIPSKFDGHWEGEFLVDKGTCTRATGKFEIRYGQVIGDIFDGGRRMATIWGNVTENGELAAEIGKVGIVGATAEVSFDGDVGTGRWTRRSCEGSVNLKKV